MRLSRQEQVNIDKALLDAWCGISNQHSQRISACHELDECHECGMCVHIPDAYISSNCGHAYCLACAAKIINNSLSLLNDVPRCGFQNCKKVLNIAHCPRINEFLLGKYQTKQNDLQLYRKDRCVIRGFMLNAVRHRKPFPLEIVELIHDFFKLVLFSELECPTCDSTGTVSKHCTHCLVDCENCKGFGKVVSKMMCFDCNGSGTSSCSLCFNGVVRLVDPCRRCHGRGTHHDPSPQSGCVECGSTGSVAAKCIACHGRGGTLYTDFAKVVQKQAMCEKCMHFSPRHLMTSWGACGHLFCVQCLTHSNFIQRELEHQRIPVCPAKHCNHELALDAFAELFGNGHQRMSSHQYSLYREVLFQIISSKGRFRCAWWRCNEWHRQSEVRSLQTCGHAYVASCAKRIWQSNLEMEQLPKCGQCHLTLSRADVEAVCDEQYVRVFDAMAYYHALKAKVKTRRTKVILADAGKVVRMQRGLQSVKFKNESRDESTRALIAFLRLLRVKVHAVRYVKHISNDQGRALFQVYVHEEEVARRVIAGSFHVADDLWRVKFWAINAGDDRSAAKRRFKASEPTVGPPTQMLRKMYGRAPQSRRSPPPPPLMYQPLRTPSYAMGHRSMNTHASDAMVCGVFAKRGGRLSQASGQKPMNEVGAPIEHQTKKGRWRQRLTRRSHR